MMELEDHFKVELEDEWMEEVLIVDLFLACWKVILWDVWNPKNSENKR